MVENDIFLRLNVVFHRRVGTEIPERTPHQADLTVRTSESESKLTVFLSNTGSYIESEDLQKIFERFHTSGKTNGTGFGLHISKHFVEAHGGKIECQSKKGNSPNENFVEFQITFNCSNFLDRTNVTHQLDRYFSVVKNDSLS